MTSYVLATPDGGFNFENCTRNSQLQASSADNIKVKAKKTGTTIAGMIFKDGVVLGADTRATSGEVVADKNCSKIHYIAPNIYCCGAGTAADTEKTTDMLRSNLTLQTLSMGRNPRLVMACRMLQDLLYSCCGAGTAADTEKTTDMLRSNLTLQTLSMGRNPRLVMACRMLQDLLYRHKGQISAMLLLGGVDCTGPHIFTVGPYGSVNKGPFQTMGSGALPALAVFEDRFKPNMNEDEAKQLVRDAITAGITNDLGSGSNVDLCVIRRDGVDYLRPFESDNYQRKRLRRYRFDRGTTPVLSEQTTKLQVDLLEETVHRMEGP
ncbi:hypothetical protein AAFF_G00250250 [Aldrovandia affinis]|uniref:proteasome endopeptidase complex n=1 Tax=Aldrovandia affinis TaxID=143900 RepID=A0AAD7RCR8_9TELE|nr:hypothetical protein AAFF_G00250250 [Aldrovandia affinis]